MIRIRTPLLILAYLASLLGAAPLFLHLQLPAQAGLVLALVAGALFDRRDSYPFRQAAATVLIFSLFAYYMLQVSLANLVNPMSNLLVLLLAVRLASEKSGRHFLQIYTLAIFCLAASSLHSLSSIFFVYLVLLVLVVTVSLVLLSFFSVDSALVLSRPQWRKLLSVSLLLPAASLVLMLFFFLILPRTQHPLWNFLNPAATAQAGFSETVDPGSVAGLAEVKRPVFRAVSEKLAAGELYWRGTVLNRIEGKSWVRREPPEKERARLAGGREVPQTIYPEPRRGSFLFTLDPPQSLSGVRVLSGGDRVFRSRRPLNRRVEIEVVSLVGATMAVDGGVSRWFYLQLPEQVSPKVRELAAGIAGQAASDREKIAMVEDFFREQQLRYSSEALPMMEDPVEGFLFEHKRGYCEFFASSFATLLRLMGVPARLVGGYHGGSYNDLGGYYLVSEDMAHVWVEAYLEGAGWTRIDPSTFADNAGSELLESRARGIAPWARLIDSINLTWNKAVIGYDLQGQFRLLRKANSSLKGVGQISLDRRLVWGLLALVAGGAGLLELFRYGRTSREESLLQAFLGRVRKHYGAQAVRENEGLVELAQRLQDDGVSEFVQIYCRCVYRDRTLDREQRRRLRQLLRRIGRPSG